MHARALLLAATLLLPLAGLAPAAMAPAAEPADQAFRGGGPYNGLGAWDAGMNGWAPIVRGLAFVEGRGVAFHSLDPILFPTDDAVSRIYQFPTCPGIRPVMGDDTPATDSAQRRIIDIALASCTQPTSEAEIFGIGVLHQVNRQMFVNAPIIHQPYADWADEDLFSGPPYRPRVTGFFEGEPVKFITYDVSWTWPWLGSGFPGHDTDLLVLSDDMAFRPGESLLNLFNGAPADVRAPIVSPLNPLPGTHVRYSPVWAATCVVPDDDPTCGALRGPAYGQCTTIAACSSIEGTHLIPHPAFTFVNCPVVNTDLDGDNYLGEPEEFDFPDLWADSHMVTVL